MRLDVGRGLRQIIVIFETMLRPFPFKLVKGTDNMIFEREVAGEIFVDPPPRLAEVENGGEQNQRRKKDNDTVNPCEFFEGHTSFHTRRARA